MYVRAYPKAPMQFLQGDIGDVRATVNISHLISGHGFLLGNVLRTIRNPKP